MKFSEIHRLTEVELNTQETQAGEQLFRLRFQKSLGNTEGTTKLRILRKDVARFKTAARQHALGLATAPTGDASPLKRPLKVRKGK